MKNTLERINSRLNDRKEWISKLENRVLEITEAEHKRVQYHQTSITRNVKGTSLSEKENTTTRNIKIMKGKS